MKSAMSDAKSLCVPKIKRNVCLSNPCLIQLLCQQFIDLLEEHPKLLLSKASIAHRGKNLYMQAPPVLEEMTRSNLSKTLYELMGKTPKDVVHATGTTKKNDKKTSCLRKLRVIFKGVDGITDMETAAGVA